MKKITLTIFTSLLVISLFAQDKEETSQQNRPLNNININLLGNASIISINYERLVLIKDNNFITWKLGFGYNEEFCLVFCNNDVKEFYTIPHHITANFGVRKHYFETGLGGTIVTNAIKGYYFYPIIGYRIQSIKTQNLNFRIFFSAPLDVDLEEEILFLPIGLSFGWCF